MFTRNFNAAKIREDFPILSRQIRGKPLIYLDNAATTQKPLAVIEAQSRVYREQNANVHRGVHWLSQETSDAYEKSRRKIAGHIGVKDEAEIIFTRGTTEAINLVASTWGRANVVAGDRIVVSRMEHHSNFVPWQSLALEKGAQFEIWELESNFTLDLGKLESILKKGKVKILAITAMSNVLGTINPIAEISKMARKYGALVVVDAAQSMAHIPVSLKSLPDVDFIAFSAHKMCGPTGIGVLWGRRSLLEKMPPYQFGGNMISRVNDEATTWADIPFKFEAGTPNYGDSIAFGTSLDYLAEIGMDKIHAYETELVEYARKKLLAIPRVRVLAPEDSKQHGSVLSFTCEHVHPHDMATFLDAEGIAIRAGHHCAQPLMRKMNVIATNRASFYFYNLPSEVDRLAEVVKGAMEYFG